MIIHSETPKKIIMLFFQENAAQIKLTNY
jgi:hypothetical protein